MVVGSHLALPARVPQWDGDGLMSRAGVTPPLNPHG